MSAPEPEPAEFGAGEAEEAAQRGVACVGVGNVGRSWAVVFARAGMRVRLWDADASALEVALARIEGSLGELERAGRLPSAAAAMARIAVAESLGAALDGVAHVQESAFESLPVKRALFAELDARAPEAVTLASSTSAISGSAFMETLPGRARCLVVHPVNPPHLIKLVEVCPSPWTAPKVVEAAAELMRAVGQAPVVLRREIDGFLLNRLQWALLGEALHLVGEGYCDAGEIDTVVTQGLAPRWSFIGPFEVGHLNATAGLDGYFGGLREAIQRVQRSLRTDYPPDETLVARLHAELAERVPVDSIPERQAWRDRRLLKTAAAADEPG